MTQENVPTVEELVQEFRKKEGLIEPDGFLADVGEDYEAVDFNVEVMEEWLRATLTTRDQAIREDERARLVKEIGNIIWTKDGALRHYNIGDLANDLLTHLKDTGV